MKENNCELKDQVSQAEKVVFALFPQYSPFLGSVIGLNGACPELAGPISNVRDNDELYSASTEFDPLQELYDQIRSFPLLTPEEETALNIVIKEGKNVQTNPKLSTQERLRQSTITEVAREIFVLTNIGLAGKIARRYCNKFGRGPYELKDFFQDGLVGLIKAVDSFDHRKGWKFSTYASKIISTQIIQAYVWKARMIRIPEARTAAIRKAVALSHQPQTSQSFEDLLITISNQMGKEPDEIRRLLSDSALEPTSLDSSKFTVFPEEGKGRKMTIGEQITDPQARNGPGHLEKNELKETVEALLLSTLNWRQAQVILLRFGFKDGENKEVPEIARRLKICKNTVHNDLKQARSILKPYLDPFYYQTERRR